MAPKEAHSTVLSIEEEAVIVAFRRHTLLPLDDCLYALQPRIPRLTRSSLHRCLQHHNINYLWFTPFGEETRRISRNGAGAGPAEVLYPGVEDGLLGVRFTDTCVRSSACNAAWVTFT